MGAEGILRSVVAFKTAWSHADTDGHSRGVSAGEPLVFGHPEILK